MSDFSKLTDMMTRLRDPEKGCPWDLVQTPQTLKAYILEEAYEVVEAIDQGDPKAICEELGDLLFQIVFQAQIHRETGHFDVSEVINNIAQKMERRHPHVFGNGSAQTPEEVKATWEVIKREEKGEKSSVLDGTPRSLPALLRAWRITQKASSVGFDWDRPAQVMEKVREEVGELEDAMDDPDAAFHEIGDLLFAIVNLARHLEINSEEALKKATDRFEKRFQFITDSLRGDGRSPEDTDLEELESLWKEAKNKGF